MLGRETDETNRDEDKRETVEKRQNKNEEKKAKTHYPADANAEKYMGEKEAEGVKFEGEKGPKAPRGKAW